MRPCTPISAPLTAFSFTADLVCRRRRHRTITQAIETAKAQRPDLDVDLFDFFRDIMLLKVRGSLKPSWVMRFQQLTGPVMAKSVEDTAFYCFNRLVSLNEVGGDPGRFGLSPDEFHAASADAQARWPLSMLASSTHDTKRSEDVRARIHLLSEIPDQWSKTVWRWTRSIPITGVRLIINCAGGFYLNWSE